MFERNEATAKEAQMRPNSKRYAALLVLMLLAVTLTACVRQQQYRHVNSPGPGKLPAIEDHKDKGYKLAFIEFKDNGDPHDPQQAIKAEELIRTERKGSSTQWEASSVVLIYVHGWKNNANEAPPSKYKDVEKFKQTLTKIVVATGLTRKFKRNGAAAEKLTRGYALLLQLLSSSRKKVAPSCSTLSTEQKHHQNRRIN